MKLTTKKKAAILRWIAARLNFPAGVSIAIPPPFNPSIEPKICTYLASIEAPLYEFDIYLKERLAKELALHLIEQKAVFVERGPAPNPPNRIWRVTLKIVAPPKKDNYLYKDELA